MGWAGLLGVGTGDWGLRTLTLHVTDNAGLSSHPAGPSKCGEHLMAADSAALLSLTPTDDSSVCVIDLSHH